MPLLSLAGREDGRRLFLLSWAAGTLAWCGIIYWIPFTLQFYGGLPWPAAYLALLLLAGFLGLYVAVFATLAGRVLRSPVGLPLLTLPSLWVALEFTKNYLLSGFPWMLLAYSQYERLEWIQIADLGGPYAVSFVIVLVNAAVYLAFLGPRPRHAWRRGAMAAACAAAVYAYGLYRLDRLEASLPSAPTLRVGVLQGNIEQGVKWSPAYRGSTTEIYGTLAQGARAEGANLIIWPEASAPYYLNRSPEGQALVHRIVDDVGVPMLVGSLASEEGKGGRTARNSAYLLGSGRRFYGRYDKVHLVPFGEFVPLAGLLPIDKLTAAAGNFVGGHGPGLLSTDALDLGLLICYESIFPELTRAAARRGADLLVVITNDAWFGPTSAPVQHLAMAAFRAVETRRSIARAANTGISAFIEPTGRIADSLRLQARGYLTADLPLTGWTTLYARWGDVGALLAICVVGVFLLRDRKRASTES
ncbi:MAG: apolipoprotein N-acyltransferase [Nitrospirae bacterium]|nr:apolipoprotein N-acyltransferase [Nitrospirota bacterium]